MTVNYSKCTLRAVEVPASTDQPVPMYNVEIKFIKFLKAHSCRRCHTKYTTTYTHVSNDFVKVVKNIHRKYVNEIYKWNSCIRMYISKNISSKLLFSVKWKSTGRERVREKRFRNGECEKITLPIKYFVDSQIKATKTENLFWQTEPANCNGFKKKTFPNLFYQIWSSSTLRISLSHKRKTYVCSSGNLLWLYFCWKYFMARRRVIEGL